MWHVLALLSLATFALAQVAPTAYITHPANGSDVDAYELSSVITFQITNYGDLTTLTQAYVYLNGNLLSGTASVNNLGSGMYTLDDYYIPGSQTLAISYDPSPSTVMGISAFTAVPPVIDIVSPANNSDVYAPFSVSYQLVTGYLPYNPAITIAGINSADDRSIGIIFGENGSGSTTFGSADLGSNAVSIIDSDSQTILSTAIYNVLPKSFKFIFPVNGSTYVDVYAAVATFQLQGFSADRVSCSVRSPSASQSSAVSINSTGYGQFQSTKETILSTFRAGMNTLTCTYIDVSSSISFMIIASTLTFISPPPFSTQIMQGPQLVEIYNQNVNNPFNVSFAGTQSLVYGPFTTNSSGYGMYYIPTIGLGQQLQCITSDIDYPGYYPPCLFFTIVAPSAPTVRGISATIYMQNQSISATATLAANPPADSVFLWTLLLGANLIKSATPVLTPSTNALSSFAVNNINSPLLPGQYTLKLFFGTAAFNYTVPTVFTIAAVSTPDITFPASGDRVYVGPINVQYTSPKNFPNDVALSITGPGETGPTVGPIISTPNTVNGGGSYTFFSDPLNPPTPGNYVIRAVQNGQTATNTFVIAVAPTTAGRRRLRRADIQKKRRANQL